MWGDRENRDTLADGKRLEAEPEDDKGRPHSVAVGTVLEVIFWKRSSRTERAKCFEVPREPAGNGTR